MFDAGITQRFVPEEDPGVGLREEPIQGGRRRIFAVNQIEEILIALSPTEWLKIIQTDEGEFCVLVSDDSSADDPECVFSYKPEDS